MFTKLLPILLILSLIITYGVAVNAQDTTLVWSDEFDTDQIDEDKWSFQLGTGSSEGLNGWGNYELQYYTDRSENVFIEDGRLHIVARAERYKNMNYTSARLRTIHKGDWRYGRIEVKAKLPKGQGLWPAIWMLPTEEVYGGWAASGEIDIMELVGHEPDVIHGTIHYGGEWPENTYSGGSFKLDSGDFSDDFHVFAIQWDEGQIVWYIDGEEYYRRTFWRSDGNPFPAPFDQRFHLLLNVAVGGTWPGNPDSSTEFPQEMVVEYVRVYQDDRDNSPAEDYDGNGGSAGPSTPGDLKPVNLPLDFEDQDVNWNMKFFDFDGGQTDVVENPDKDSVNDSDYVGLMRKNGGRIWGGSFMHLNTPFKFSSDNHTITMKVWSPREDVPVLMKVEQQDGSQDYELAVNTTTSGEWEELTWDMSGAGFSNEWDIITLIFDLRNGQEGDGSADFTWYFDDLEVDADFVETTIEDVTETIPGKFNLQQNYPNPFNPTTNIRFDLPERSNVSLNVYNVMGQRVAVLANEVFQAGTHQVTFDASSLTSGMYLYQLETENFQQTKKMLLIQ